MEAPHKAIYPIVDHIRDALWPRSAVSGTASIMVGAGFSRNAVPLGARTQPMPLWHDLAGRMQARLGFGSDRPRDPLRLAQLFEATFGRAEFERFLEREIADTGHRPGELHARLLQLPWADVFTTNYDTLLERSAEEAGLRYEVIMSSRDVPLRQGRRLVKLHGTIGSGGGLIGSQEDYRRYPRTHAAFVNMVRQSVMETVFVLVGFTGDDPNFLEWTGWVRDELGPLAPRIYLCGLLDSSPAELALLQQRQVTPLDLSPLFPRGADRHARALDWLLAALENGRPGRDIEWAPLEAAQVETRQPPLPPAKVFTPAHVQPVTEWRTVPLDTFRAFMQLWHAQRLEYPGWHVAPDVVRERVGHYLEWHRLSVFGRAGEMGVLERIKLLHELCWRLELTLSPIFTQETDQLVRWLSAIDPFGGALAMEGAETLPAEVAADIRPAWCHLALAVLRTAREDLDLVRYRTWRERLLAVSEGDRSLLGELAYEEALFHLNALDLEGFGRSLEDWKREASQPLERLRLAVLFAEAGDRAAAAELATSALSGTREDYESAATLAIDSWASILLSCLDWRDERRRNEWRRRTSHAKRQEYDAWETIERFRTRLKDATPRARSSRVRTAGFDPHSFSRTRDPRGASADTEAAWQLLRLIERAPCPIRACGVGVASDIAANSAAWIVYGAPHWSVSTLIRCGPSAEVWDEVFGREVVATMEDIRVTTLHRQMLGIARKALDQPSGGEATGIARQLVGGAVEVLSRLAFRLPQLELEQLLASAIRWLRSMRAAGYFEHLREVAKLIERSMAALPDTALAPVIPRLLDLPLPGEREFPSIYYEIWPEPFEWMPRSVPLPERMPELDLTVRRLVERLRGADPAGRERAFTRLAFLDDAGWLSESEREAFGDALWSKLDERTGMPMITRYYPHAFLDTPGAEKKGAEANMRKLLLAQSWIDWAAPSTTSLVDLVDRTETRMRNLKSVCADPAACPDRRGRITMSAEEAARLADQLLEKAPSWLATFKSKEWNSTVMFHEETPARFASALAAALGQVALMGAPPAQARAEQVLQLRQAFKDNGYPSLGLAPGILRAAPSIAEEVANDFEAALVSADEEHFTHATAGLAIWNKCAAAGAVSAPPEKLFDALSSRIFVRHRPRLTSALRAAGDIFAHGRFPGEGMHRVLVALELLLDETAPTEVRAKYRGRLMDRTDVMDLLSIRAFAAGLAAILFRRFAVDGESAPAVIGRWQTVAGSDLLPEVRLAWSNGLKRIPQCPTGIPVRR